MVAKSREAKTKQIRKAIGQQLRFIRRNLNNIERIKEGGELNAKEAKTPSVLKKLHQQQKYMYENKVHSVDNRIVSIARPIPGRLSEAKPKHQPSSEPSSQSA